MEQGPPNVAANDCESKGIALDGFEALTKNLNELVTKVVTSLSVPREDPL